VAARLRDIDDRGSRRGDGGADRLPACRRSCRDPPRDGRLSWVVVLGFRQLGPTPRRHCIAGSAISAT